jgi:hypothetical protein
MVLRPDFAGKNLFLKCRLTEFPYNFPCPRNVEDHCLYMMRKYRNLSSIFDCRSLLADKISRGRLSRLLVEIKNRQSKIQNPNAPLAQLAEQVTLNHWVAGSIPARCNQKYAFGKRTPWQASALRAKRQEAPLLGTEQGGPTERTRAKCYFKLTASILSVIGPIVAMALPPLVTCSRS